MRTPLFTLLALLAVTLFAVAAQAQGFGAGIGYGVCNFVDEDGDGFNDLAPDADGDGIPNGLDDDYIPAGDGTGSQFQWGRSQLAAGGMTLPGFNAMKSGEFAGQGHRYGLGDGSGDGTGPADGTGFGPGNGTNDGECDGTGNDGALARRGGRR